MVTTSTHSRWPSIACAALAALLLQGAVTLATTKRGDARLGSALARLPLESTFSFTLGGAPSSHLLPAWNRTTAAFRGRKPSSGREAVDFTRERVVYFQPTPPAAGVVPATDHGRPLACAPGATEPVCASFGLQLIVERTLYPALPGGATAAEWLLKVRNVGTKPSQPLCAVRTLDAVLQLPSAANLTLSAFTGGGSGGGPAHGFGPPAEQIGQVPAGANNYHPRLARFPPGARHSVGSGAHGRSSEGGLPFWSAWTTAGAAELAAGAPLFSGLTASVGWSGYWSANFSRDATGLRLTAGQGE
jgi:hypothetical protein